MRIGYQAKFLYSTLLNFLRNPSATPPETNSATVSIQPCVDDLTLTASVNFTPQDPYTANNTIVSTQNIYDGHTVRYEAGVSITLNNGFVSGTDFIAEIKPCYSKVTTIAAKTEDIQYAKDIDYKNNINVAVDWMKIYPTITASGNAVQVVSYSYETDLTTAIFDLQGKQVGFYPIKELLPNEAYALNLPTLAKGYYLIQVKNQDRSPARPRL